MSDVQKPVEETPVAAPATTTEAAPAATEAPATTETPEVVEAPKETTEEAKPAAAEETAEAEKPKEEETEAKEEAKPTPATDGVLGYKAPGLVKGLRFSKRYFWFSDEAVESKNLTTYFANEKHSVSHPTGAWASQTGKGLLFFTKRAEDKATPTGIINLADVSDIAKDGGSEFHFKFNGHKHAFQANTAAERDSWVAALENKSTEAKAEKESILESEGYKAELEKMTKPPVVGTAASAPKKSTELKTPKEEKTETEAATPAADDKEAAKDAGKETQKSRSQSRKRASIFGSFLNKKEEPAEEKKEEKTEAKEEPAAEEAPAAEAAAPAEAATTEAAAEPAAETEAKSEEKKEEKTEAKAEGTTSTKNKRASIFGNFFQKVGSPTQEKSEKESAPAVPAKDKDTTVSSTAPQLGDPVDASASKPIEPESVTAPAEGEAPKTEAGTSPSSKSGLLSFIKKDGKKETKAEDKPAEEAATTEATATSEPEKVTKDKRRTSMFGSLGGKKEKKTEEGAESDSKSKSNKLGGLFRKPSKAVKPTEKKEETPATETEAIPEGGEKTETTEATNGVEATEEKKETIGDVSADAVNVGPSNTTPVQAAA
ncbi:hypothetical protein FQN54_002047 [Arachnomyces sp. PD_36]|nr:hypothetical protein FQN54_002047 [Arachnomyces sp. PD_36]